VTRVPLRAATLGVGIAAVCIAAEGCALLPHPKVEIGKAILNQLPPDVPHRDSHGQIVLVLPPDTTPPYDTLQMAYRTQSHEVAYFSQHEWAATPPRMLYPLLVKTLENTGAFSAVVAAPYTGRYDYALRTEILELIQEFTSDPAALVLSLRFQLTDYGAKQVIATKEISVREPMQQRNSSAGIVAANAASAQALQQVAAFVLEKTD
jgi:cholesterol transport system auxiliary component